MSIEDLELRVGKQWPAIQAAKASSSEKIALLARIVAEGNFDSPDISVVAFGSLARREWTGGSDLDWTMLIDGQADNQHATAVGNFSDHLVQAGFQRPGPTRTFGTLTFSHNLVHEIGGLDDSNRNTTQRLLLLLESTPIATTDAYDRAVRAVLRRYLQNDFRSFRYKVPLFLLNDLHRFWRTMCVDYASKYRERAGAGWGIRLVKLRMSRKLVFVSGMLACYLCDERFANWLGSPPTTRDFDSQTEQLRLAMRKPPLEAIAELLLRTDDPELSRQIFDAYDEFLKQLDRADIREHLSKLAPNASSSSDSTFQSVVELADQFQSGLEKLFFDWEPLRQLNRQFGVF